jgi:hypothetical protein
MALQKRGGAHPEMADFGSGQGRRDVEMDGAAV